MLKRWQPFQIALQDAAEKEDAPKHAPKVSGPTKHRSHPFDRWGEDPETIVVIGWFDFFNNKQNIGAKKTFNKLILSTLP